MTSNHSGAIGRRLSTWRRLLLLFGPAPAKKVGLALAEFAWPDKNNPDAELVARNCTQEILCSLCDYTALRGLRKQLAVLQDAGWIGRKKDQTGPGVYREYVLRIPDRVPHDAIAEMMSPSRGMWRRALAAKIGSTGEPEFLCSQVSGEPEFRNRGTLVPEQGNVSSPLKGLPSSPLGQRGKGGVPMRGPPDEKTKTASNRSGQPPFAVMLDALLAADIRGSQWDEIDQFIEDKFGFTPSNNQKTVFDRQLRDRRRE